MWVTEKKKYFSGRYDVCVWIYRTPKLYISFWTHDTLFTINTNHKTQIVYCFDRELTSKLKLPNPVLLSQTQRSLWKNVKSSLLELTEKSGLYRIKIFYKSNSYSLWWLLRRCFFFAKQSDLEKKGGFDDTGINM